MTLVAHGAGCSRLAGAKPISSVHDSGCVVVVNNPEFDAVSSAVLRPFDDFVHRAAGDPTSPGSAERERLVHAGGFLEL